jgi:endonuclease/exonuclease/phosphatase family metal-dependent hydrolase
VTLDGDRFRFFNTHLDSNSPAVNFAQAVALGVKVAVSPLPVIVVGDVNASAEGAGSPTYDVLLDWGLGDAWTALHPHNPGLTWGATPPSDRKLDLSQRSDLVLFEGAFEVDDAHLVGGRPSDRTPKGLWPSDHRGVVATLELP